MVSETNNVKVKFHSPIATPINLLLPVPLPLSISHAFLSFHSLFIFHAVTLW